MRYIKPWWAVLALMHCQCGSVSSHAPATQNSTALPSDTPAEVRPTSVKTQALHEQAQGNTEFALALYAALGTQRGNLFFSPASISATLSMVYAGSAGKTSAEMAKVLHFKDTEQTPRVFSALLQRWSSDPQNTLVLSNRLFGEQSVHFEAPFVELTQRWYGAPLEMLDIQGQTEASRKHINQWVQMHSQGHIRDLIPHGQLDPSSIMALANAIYFKGQWATAFDPHKTAQEEFIGLQRHKIHTPMMHARGRFRYAELPDKGLQVLSLPYLGDAFEMQVLLPEAGKHIRTLERILTPALLNSLNEQQQSTEVDLALPRFKLAPKTSMELSALLQALGLRLLFSDAQLSGISPEAKKLSQVFHKGFLSVDEAGTEAAAATAAVVTRSMRRRPEFRANRPFIVMIWHKPTQSLLFMGRVEDPTK